MHAAQTCVSSRYKPQLAQCVPKSGAKVCMCVCEAAQWATHYDELYLNPLAALVNGVHWKRAEQFVIPE